MSDLKWSTGSNWTGGSVPTATATIRAHANGQPTLDSSASVAALKLDQDPGSLTTLLTIGSGGQLTVAAASDADFVVAQDARIDISGASGSGNLGKLIVGNGSTANEYTINGQIQLVNAFARLDVADDVEFAGSGKLVGQHNGAIVTTNTYQLTLGIAAEGAMTFAGNGALANLNSIRATSGVITVDMSDISDGATTDAPRWNAEGSGAIEFLQTPANLLVGRFTRFDSATFIFGTDVTTVAVVTEGALFDDDTEVITCEAFLVFPNEGVSSFEWVDTEFNEHGCDGN